MNNALDWQVHEGADLGSYVISARDETLEVSYSYTDYPADPQAVFLQYSWGQKRLQEPTRHETGVEAREAAHLHWQDLQAQAAPAR